MSPLEGDARPLPKTAQLARGDRRYRRKVAGAKRWQQIADAKQGPCRVCFEPAPNELHHILSRAHGGSDTEANIAPLCRRCHDRITRRVETVVRMFLVSLTDAEYSYAVHHGGEDFWERAYGLRYSR